MADIQTETLQALRRLERVMNDLPNSIMAAGTRVPRTATNKEKFKFDNKNPIKDDAEQKRLSKAMEDQTKASKMLFKDFNKVSSDMLIAGGMFDKAVKQMSFKNFEQLPSKLNDVMGSLHGEIKTYEDVIRLQKRSIMSNVNAAEQLYRQFLKLDPGMKGYENAIDSVTKEMEKTGYSMEDFSGYTADAAGTMQKLKNNAEQGAKGLKEVADSSAAAAARGKTFAKVLEFLGGAALVVGQYLMTSATAAMKYGTTAAPIASLLAGMSPENFAKLQKDNIQAARSGFKSLTDFNSSLDQGASKLFAYTGSLEAGARLRAGEINQFQSLGKNIGSVNDFVNVQEKQFVKLNRIVSITGEEFTQLNEQLMNSSVVQAQLYKLGAQQRVAYYEDLQNARQKLVLDGLTIEQAQKVVETFQQIAGESPQNRIKQAAKLQAIGGAIGLAGPDLNRLADLIRSGARTPEAMSEIADIEKRMQPQLQAITANQSATLGTETSFRALVDQVPELLGANNIAAGLGITGKGLNQTQQNAALTTDFLGKIAGPNGEITSGFSQTVVAVGKVQNVMQTVGLDLKNTLIKGFGAIGTLMVGGSILKGIKGSGLLGRLIPGLGGASEAGEAAAGAGTAAGLGTAALTTGAVAAAGAVGYGAGTLINMIPKVFGGQNLSDYIGGWLNDKFGPKVKSSQFNTHEYEATKALTTQIHALTDQMSKLNNKEDPAKAVDKMHKTLKDQHQEDKQMTQEQIDTFKKTHKVIMTKTSRDLLGPSF